MHLTALAVLLFVTAAPAQISEEEPSSGYHQLVGIPLAERIKAREEGIHLEANSRIYKGGEVYDEELEYYSFFGGLIIHVINSNTSVCGSALLSNNLLVTAAHCWDDGNSKVDHFTVVFSSVFLFAGGMRIETNNVTTHPSWDTETLDNDIAVIHLPHKVNLSNTIFPIALPEGSEITNSFESYSARAIGFGDTEDPSEGQGYRGPSLKKVDLEIISDEECRKTFLDSPTSGQLCTSGKDGIGPCNGDSGGPLITYNDRKFLVGINSFGRFCGIGNPNVYTRVSRYISFIESHGKLPKFTFHWEQQPGLLLENITISITDDESEELQEFTHFYTIFNYIPNTK